MKKKISKNIVKLEISSPARLHLGFYGIKNNYGYSYGSMGLGIKSYDTKLLINRAKNFATNLPKKYIGPIIKYLKSNNIKTNININVIEKSPSHIGLGSGTQLSLCVGKMISEFLKLSLTTKNIAEIYKRGERSGIGISVFEKGGFVLDSCKKKDMQPKTLMHSKFPSVWKIILLNDTKLKGISGDKENRFFLNNKNSKKYERELSHIILRGILPSLAYADFTNFANSITEFQRITALFYKKKQSGVFLSPEISKVMKYIENFDNIGIGQSSWGPTSYIFVDSLLHAKELISVIENKFNVYNNLSYKIVSPSNSGYKIKYN